MLPRFVCVVQITLARPVLHHRAISFESRVVHFTPSTYHSVEFDLIRLWTVSIKNLGIRCVAKIQVLEKTTELPCTLVPAAVVVCPADGTARDLYI